MKDMSKVLRKIVREMVRIAEAPEKSASKERPTPTGQTGPRGTWGGRRVYDKETGEEFDVVAYNPSEPGEEVENVTLVSRDRSKGGKKIKVSYDEFLGNYKRHSGQPISTPIRRPTRKFPEFDEEIEIPDAGPPTMSRRIKNWAGSELAAQGAERKDPSEYSRDMKTWGFGPVDVDPETGKMTRLPNKRGYLEGPLDSERGWAIELEKAMDKLDIVGSHEGLYKKMSAPYLEQYKNELIPSIQKAQERIKRYLMMLLTSNSEAKFGNVPAHEKQDDDVSEIDAELSTDDLRALRKENPARLFALIWELSSFHDIEVPKLKLSSDSVTRSAHVSTISSIAAATGQLSVKNLSDPKVEDAIRKDPGFVVWLNTLDKVGSQGKFWNEFRAAVEQLGDYRGQF